MSHNLVKDGFNFDIHRAHMMYKKRQEENMAAAIAEVSTLCLCRWCILHVCMCMYVCMYLCSIKPHLPLPLPFTYTLPTPQAKREAERAARREAINKAYKDANFKRRGATLLGNLQDEDDSTSCGSDSDKDEEEEEEEEEEDGGCDGGDFTGSMGEDAPAKAEIANAATAAGTAVGTFPASPGDGRGASPVSPNTLASYMRPGHTKLNKEELRDLAIAMRNIHIFYRNYGKNISAADNVTGILEYRSEAPREVLVTPNTPYGISMLPLHRSGDAGHRGGENIGPVLVHVGPPPPAGQGAARGGRPLRGGTKAASREKEKEKEKEALTLDLDLAAGGGGGGQPCP